jgi:5,5'-dehydrodivanillate O-demethylase oxygenase subunit
MSGVPQAAASKNSKSPEVKVMQETNRNLRVEQLNLLHHTSADTLMGKLLRLFWQPIAISDHVAEGAALPIRILGEDLTLYRGTSGKPFLVDGRCAHRCTVLHTGWVQDDTIRCMYHGWLYDGTGQCLEMPAEKGARPESVKIKGYPVRDYCGLVFAYMGEAPAPEFDLPRRDILERAGRNIIPGVQVWDCNWFQQIENSMDSAHIGFAHTWGAVSRFQEEISTAVPDLAYEETSSGIRQIATRSKTNVRISDWTFPNNNHIRSPGPQKGDPWIDRLVWAVPIDDESTARFTITSAPDVDPETNTRIAETYTSVLDPAEHAAELFFKGRIPHAGAQSILASQDYVAVRGQGKIVDRSQERLAKTDAGIAFLRRIFQRELTAIREGRATKQWKRPQQDIELPIQVAEPAAP